MSTTVSGNNVTIDKVLRIKAPAKVNLFLHVVGKREDGYHDLKTYMQKLSLYDEIEICLVEEHSGLLFACDDNNVPSGGNNLVVRAARAFKEASCRIGKLGLEISLKKNIPIAAGLGGGSSDAGATLLGLNELCGNEFSEQELIGLATPLGADVPFFATRMSAAYAEGVGEKLYPAESALKYVFVLVNPGFAVSTKEIFQNLLLTTKSQQSILTRPLREERCNFTLDYLHNDLEKVTCKVYPQLDELKRKLKSLGALAVMMSGSGPTVFGVFRQSESEEELSHIHRILSVEYGEKVFVVKAI